MKRKFFIGDEWLYYKIYCGPKTADDVLKNIIQSAMTELLKKGIIVKWFFIRYSDPKLHLRVRFHLKNIDNISIIVNTLNTLSKPYLEHNLIHKIQLDTYQRELERYGNNTMELAEELFFYDSDMIVSFIDLIEGDEGEQIRWLFGLRAIDAFLDAFSYNDETKLNLLQGLKDGFSREFGMNKMLKLQLDKKYRKHRQLIDHFFENKYKEENIDVLITLIRKKSFRVRKISEKVIKMNSNNLLEVPLDNLMGSYIHMLMNRLFMSKQRMNEMVVYDFLYRYYKSMIAKRKYKPELVNQS